MFRKRRESRKKEHPVWYPATLHVGTLPVTLEILKKMKFFPIACVSDFYEVVEGEIGVGDINCMMNREGNVWVLKKNIAQNIDLNDFPKTSHC